MIDRDVTLTSNTHRSVSCDERTSTNPKKSEQNFTLCDKAAIRMESGGTYGGQEKRFEYNPISGSMLAKNSSIANVASTTTLNRMEPKTVPEQEWHDRCRQQAATSIPTSILKSRLNASVETVPTKRLTDKVRPRDSNLDIDSSEISRANSPFTADTHIINMNNSTANNNYIVHNDTDYTNSTNAVTIFVIKTVLPDD